MSHSIGLLKYSCTSHAANLVLDRQSIEKNDPAAQSAHRPATVPTIAKFSISRGVARARKDVAALDRSGPEPPQQTYSESPHVVSDGNRRIELHHFTFGHTRGDTFVYLPKEKIICTGDAVVNGPFSHPKHAYMRGQRH